MENKVNEIMETTENVTKKADEVVAQADLNYGLLAATVIVAVMAGAFGKDVYGLAKKGLKRLTTRKQKVEIMEVDPDETDFTEA